MRSTVHRTRLPDEAGSCGCQPPAVISPRHGGALNMVRHDGAGDDLFHVVHKAHVSIRSASSSTKISMWEGGCGAAARSFRRPGRAVRDIDALLGGRDLQGWPTPPRSRCCAGSVLAVRLKLSPIAAPKQVRVRIRAPGRPFLFGRGRRQTVRHRQRKGCGLAGAVWAVVDLKPAPADGRCLNGRGDS